MVKPVSILVTGFGRVSVKTLATCLISEVGMAKFSRRAAQQRRAQASSVNNGGNRPLHFYPGAGNLSYSIVTTLPKFLPATSSSQVPVRVVVHPYDIPVIYNEVRTLVPRLYDAYSHDVDIWLHFGMRPGQNSYSMQLVSRRDGYDQDKDITGHMLPASEGDSFFRGCPESLDTTLDTEDVFTRWRSKLLDAPEISPELGSVRIRQSREAGHFICDFLYYSVLAEHWRRKSGVMGALNNCEEPGMSQSASCKL
ncbi:peptidase C15, pyroglutamyl peptidase I-like protein, partial [Aureobasidium melanogenum]